jgi:23S rRNA pseudouridine1911/1915/1917 synthase
MSGTNPPTANCQLPTILDETEDFAVVFKPPRMHCAPLHKGGDTLLDWYAGVFPPVMDMRGRKEGEGGLLHRLDFETQGLVLFAKNQNTLDHLLRQQDEGRFIKEYNATCHKPNPDNCSLFIVHCPLPPPPFNVAKNGFPPTPFVIESFFRAYGPGRKQVRPVTEAAAQSRKIRREIAQDQGGYYRTEIVTVIENEYYALSLRLKRGFRHQIRCHLAWIGCPVQNDPVYGEGPADGFLALRSHGLSFADPHGGKPREYHIGELGVAGL